MGDIERIAAIAPAIQPLNNSSRVVGNAKERGSRQHGNPHKEDRVELHDEEDVMLPDQATPVLVEEPNRLDIAI